MAQKTTEYVSESRAAAAERSRRAWADPEKRERMQRAVCATLDANRYLSHRSLGKTWKRADGGATLGKQWKTGKPAWNRKEPVVRVCHYPGCDAVISTPPSLARIKACCQQHQYIPTDRRDSPYAPGWPAIREAVWERDGYRCLACRKQPKRPECHHLDYDKLNNDKSNLATQCSGCHQGGHRRNAWPIELGRRVSQ